MHYHSCVRALATSIHVRTYLPKFNRLIGCTTIVHTAVPWGFFYSKTSLLGTKHDANLEIMSFQVFLYQPLHASRSEEKLESTVKNTKFRALLAFVSLSLHLRSPRRAERIRQGKGRRSRRPKTALERSDLTENFQFRESHTEAETKKTPDQIPVP